MKKALVLLLALCAVSAFAQDAAYTLEAEASVTWGYNLNDDSTGFVNDASFDLVFPIAAGATASNEAVDGVYGQITITGLNFALTSNMDGGSLIDNLDEDGYYDEFTAKIMAGPLYATIYSKPSFKLNNAKMMGPISIDEWEDASNTANTAGSTGGVTFGYANEMFDVSLLLGSNGDYEGTDLVVGEYQLVTIQSAYTVTAADFAAARYVDLDYVVIPAATVLPAGLPVLKLVDEAAAKAANVDGQYTVGLAITLTPVEMIEFKFKAFADMWDGANKGLTLKATVTPIEGLEAVAAFDGKIVGSADMLWDSSFGVTYTLANASSVEFSTYFAPKETVSAADAYLETGLTFTEDGAEGFVPALGAVAYAKAYNLLGDDPAYEGVPVYIGLALDYTVTLEEGKTVMPYAAADFGLLSPVAGEKELTFKVGTDINLIANTTITVEYAAGEVKDDATAAGYGQIKRFGSDAGEDKGVFTISCTIEL